MVLCTQYSEPSLEKFARMMAGVDHFVGAADQLAAGVLGDGAELVVNLGDYPAGIGDGDDGVGIQGGLDLGDFTQ